MPLARYEIRNAYRLSDPEVYRAADKDDPEALLEGVAMAGLIGILRQLGDLADFAAEIFRDLHEEVMATAARGHGLMVRVQQLEAEFPSIEKAFLSQTSHMHFAHTVGLDYRSSLRMDQNLVTQGNLPRFIMDSYEECRGPPRLFLLDKFDVAGAGACLKRYSDPSSFKMELLSSEMRKSDEVQREKRARKSKKKGLRLRNGGAPASHASSKLYHLFATSDEQNQIPTNTSTHGLKLKTRQFIGSPFSNSRTKKSYMECVIEMQLSESKFACESSVKPSNEKSSNEELDMGIVDSSNILVLEERTYISSLNGQREVAGDLNNNVIEEKNVVSFSKPISELEEEKIPSTYSHVDQKDVLVDGESKMEGSADGDESDGMASELENYMDALTTMESETETDSEYRTKHESAFNIEHQSMDSNKNEEQQELPTHCSDSLSNANSVASCDSNELSKKGRSSFPIGDSLRNCAALKPSQVTETTSTDLPANTEHLFGLHDEVSSLVYDNPCFEPVESASSSLDNEIIPAENGDINFKRVSINNGVLGAKSPEFLDLYESGNEVIQMASYFPQIGEASSESFLSNLDSNPIHLSSNMSELKLDRSHSTETSPCCLDASKYEEETPPSCAESGKAEEESSPICLEASKSEEETSSSCVGASKADARTSSSSVEACKDEQETSPDCAEVPNAQEETSSGTEETSKADEEAFPFHGEDSKVEVATSRIEEVSDHLGGDLPNISDLLSRTSGAADLENLPPEEYRSDGSAAEYSEGSILDSPCSVVTPEVHSRSLFEQNTDCFLEIDNFVCPSKKSEDLRSIVNLQQTNDFSEHELQKTTARIQLVELEHFPEADFSSKSHLHNSGMMDSAESADMPMPSRTGEILLSKNLDVLPNSQLDDLANTSNLLEVDCANIDFPGAHIDHIKFTEESLPSSTAPSQELKVIKEFVLEDHLDPDDERINDKDILKNKGGPCINGPIEDFNHSEPCNPDIAELPSSEFISGVHPSPQIEHIQIALLSNCQEDSRQSDHYSEFKASSIQNLSGMGSPLEQASTVEYERESGVVVPLHQGGLSSKSSDLHFERLHVSEPMDTAYFTPDAHIKDSPNSSPMDLLCQQSETKLELHSNLNALASEVIVYEESISSPATSNHRTIEPEVGRSSSQSTDFRSLRLANVPKLRLFISEINESSVPQQLIDFSLPHSSALTDAKMEEMPPLPPLPPLQWRVGKPLPLFSVGKPEPPNSSDVLPCIEDEHNSHGGEIALPPNLSYAFPTVEDDKSYGDFPSKHTGPEDPLVEPPEYLSADLQTTEDDKHNPPLEGEMTELPPKLSTDFPTIEGDKLNGVLPSEQIRPKDPLIEALASHDKSTLKKVSERVRFKSGRPKADERQVLLEQIRAKSFSLKPTVVMRPSIQGPSTNFNVAAILEKAKAIRQAFAGSDEDDGDNWSDA